MARGLVAFAILVGLFASARASAGQSFSSDSQTQQKPRANAPAKHTLPLSEADRKTLAAIGWPKSLPPFPPSQDAVYARDGQVLSGTLTFLEAFATVQSGAGKKDIARDNVGFVLASGKAFPRKFGQLPNDEDAVMLDSGEIVKGYVNVDRAGVHVRGRTFLKKDVTLIHLKGPPETQYPDIEEPPDTDGKGSKGPGKTGETGPATKAPPSRGRGPEEIPWGKALWRGMLRWSDEHEGYCNNPNLNTCYIRGHGTYYITWKEEAVKRLPGTPGEQVEMKIVGIVYNATCGGDDIPDKTIGGSVSGDSMSSLSLYVKDFGPGTAGHTPAGTYDIRIWSPTSERICGDDPPFFTRRTWQKGLSLGCGSYYWTVAPDRLAPPPYTTLTDSYSCEETPAGRKHSYRLEYTFVRGAPPLNVSPDPCSACKTAQGRLAHEKDIIKSLLAEVKELSKKIREAKGDLDRLNRVKASMHNYMNALLVAAASEDIAHRLLEMVMSDGATQIGGALDEENAAAKAYIKALEAFQTCLSSAADGVKALQTGEPQDYIDYVKGVPAAAANPRCMQEGEKGEGDSFGDLVNAAKEEFELGKVLADAIGQGTGEAEAEYIQEHLQELGPLVPEEVLQHAEQYLKLTEQWTEKLKELEQLNAQVEMDTFALADHGLAAKGLEEKMGKCKSGC